MYDELVKQCRDCIDCLCGECKYEHLQKPGNFVPCMNALLGETADAIEELIKLADAIPRVCECCIGCEMEKKNGGCNNAFVLSPKRAMQYLIKPQWIPVTERLPDSKKETYWVCTDTGYQCECRWTNNMYGLGISDSWGWSIMDVPQYQKVVAWRDLPESYEPPKEEM